MSVCNIYSHSLLHTFSLANNFKKVQNNITYMKKYIVAEY